MADIIDQANDICEFLNNIVIHKISQENQISRSFCLDCGESIPVARQKAILGVKYCVDCQARKEKQSHLFNI
ncbi:hypothetical protein A6A19_07710 [Actinobacillus delphinicola]|uniref:DnaK suppressor protein n=1 Tax=Actinobacillus delphinicola TaxID=51161 RepID=A0A448TU50_9PAST|nr:TraR/DksA C4-type zinc finger protein [Actinobacillus delphinicola]MDG6897860.1 hypothetical protein [Actinobacillus delphinicola]VEJ09371.1 DnaK suppressor protein [Actinobacillus delphinicola]